MRDYESEVRQSTDIAGLKADVKNICRTLDEMKDAAGEREKLIRSVLEQTQKTNGRVNALEDHRENVCDQHTRELENLKAFKWKLMGAVGAVSYVSGVLGQESMRALVQKFTAG